MENKMEHYDSNYFASVGNVFARVVTEGAKYASLLAGIYSVCKDEKDFGAAALFGAGYVLADTIRESLRERADARRSSILEKKLEQK